MRWWLCILQCSFAFRAGRREPEVAHDIVEMATADAIVQEMEQEALVVGTSYNNLRVMNDYAISDFLTDTKKAVKEEKKSYGYSRMVEGKVAVIFGDLHGQLFNLLAHLKSARKQIKKSAKHEERKLIKLEGSKLMYCDERVQYIFMGDYVDRGERGLELTLLLLAYKQKCPRQVILLQGNHEQMKTQKKYGFLKELQYKMDDGDAMQEAFHKVFKKLPFVAVAPGHFMATHGGLSWNFVETCAAKAGNFSECLTYEMGQKMIWADPTEKSGWQPSKRGKKIKTFGLDVAADFLGSNGLRWLIRGHEQQYQGHLVQALNESGPGVQTIFSSADYVSCFCTDEQNRPLNAPHWDKDMFRKGGNGNKGAILIADLHSSDGATFFVRRLSGKKARELAQGLTGAICKKDSVMTRIKRRIKWAFSLSEKARNTTKPCMKLPEAERSVQEQEVQEMLKYAENPNFEVRKRIDLEGEADEDEDEACESLQKDQITLHVYEKLMGKAETLENDVLVRAEEMHSDPQ